MNWILTGRKWRSISKNERRIYYDGLLLGFGVGALLMFGFMVMWIWA